MGAGQAIEVETTSTRSERRKARTATAILDAAERLFVERGFAATKIEDLSAEADVAIGSIYAHFGSKEGIYEALVDRALAVCEVYVNGDEMIYGEAPLMRALGRGEGYLRFAREHPHYFRLCRFPPADRPGEGSPVREQANAAIDRETERMARLLEEAVSDGTLRPVNPRTAARFIWASWDGVIASHLGPANMNLDGEEFERLLNFAREAIVRSVLGTSGTQFLLDQAAEVANQEKEEMR
ncbi:MAG TPA: TetR/AcrR family transcriptional regulator [Solirubrobacterales bacterium]|nr:TetR/AcrR family transcriptional regulator [Solirubrobacterales bacterium]